MRLYVLLVILLCAAAPARGELASRTDGRRTVHIVVLGDSLAEGLWGSLYRRFVRAKDLRIVNAARASTGFNATPYEEQVEAILRRHPIDLLIVQAGANDRQRVLALDRNGIARFGTPRWFTLYGQRLAYFLARVERRRIPVLWVGLPVMRDEAFDRGMRIITHLHRDHAERHSATFLDIAALTANREGEYFELLSLADGRKRRFRHQDGVHFWEIGYDRVADHVAGAIRARFPGLLPPRRAGAADASP